ncbi:amidohydrolase family protein [Antarcticibacterium sp. 1MA-6-2]|uniref:amidohydrolase family protein n=1 Tax=Antarcticibacterium sp. 1MA-6-2 TaxID=2908210 RepID=UPI0028830027|nr:amidohydrolase family protein [Antarcticibacterium sp. 1MA-6-2]
MPNNKEIVVWSEGKIKRIDTESTQVADVPFQVNNTFKIAEAHSSNSKVYTENFNPKVIRHAVTSPDGKTLVFNAVGYLWKKNLPDGNPQRITKSEEFEFEPSFSPDGNRLVYVTWKDDAMGAVRTVDLNGRNSKKLTSEKGIYRNPEFSRDGSMIVFNKESGNNDMGNTFSKNPGIYLMKASGENIRKILDEGEFPMFTKDSKRIFYQTGGYLMGNLTKRLKSVDLQGKDERTHLESKYGGRLVPSPDNNWIAFSNLHKAYIAPLVMTGKLVTLGPDVKTVPVTQIAKDAGINLHWSGNSQNVHWTLGDEYFTNKVSERFTFLENSVDSIPPITESGTKIGLELKTDVPSGRIAFTNARIITMNEKEEVIENGSILVEENKIVSIGPASEVNIPKNAKIYDLKGKTIMPGMVDAHAHIGAFRYGLTPKKHWPFYVNLAYGVTTSHDPSALSETVFGMAELIKSGEMVGPRLYSTGIILYGAEGDFKAEINSLEDARSALRRTKAFGATSVKSYNQPRREQRQQVMQAAKELDMNVVPEGGSTFFHNMNMIVDGHTGIEHNIPIAPVYKDIFTLWGNSNSGYTPTLIVNYGGINGEYYFYDKTRVWENEKLLTFTPRSVIDARSRHRTTLPEEEYEEGPILVSKTAKALSDVGVKVNMGAHGQLQGLGAHWELWLIQMGGMSNMEALKTATINPADYIGLSEEIGSLEEGKLADLLVLDKNPLEDIRNTNTIIYTMVNGRLYDANTMNELGNEPKERGNFFWENRRNMEIFPWHE